MKIVFKFEEEIDIKDITFQDMRSAYGKTTLPKMWTVFCRGIPIDDTSDPEKWIKKHLDGEKF